MALTAEPPDHQPGDSPDWPDGLATIVLFVAHAVLSVVLAVSAFFNQLVFGACGSTGSAASCNYALGSGSFYAFLAAVIVVFAAVIAWMPRAHARHRPSWPIPLLGSTSILAAYLLCVGLMSVSTH